MKKLILLLLITGLFQSCCGPIYLFCPEERNPYALEPNSNVQHSGANKNAPAPQSAPSGVTVSEAPVMLSNLSPIIGIGKSGIGGKNSGNSWEDPLGGIIGVETKIYKFDENSSLKTGLNVSFQGADYSESYDTDSYNANRLKSALDEHQFSGTVKTTYLNIPFLYNYSANSGFYVEAGLQPGYLLSSKDKFDEGSYDYKDYMKKFELGLPIGAGYWVNNQLCIGARAIWGLTNNSDSGSGDKDHNYLITGTISYNIGSLFKKNK